MATSETDIANMALGRLGDKQIVSLDDGKPLSDTAKLYYASTRDALLRQHPWNFAIHRAALSRETATPNHEYTYQYLLPVDCLKVIRTGWEATGYVVSNHPFAPPDMIPVPYRIESADGGKRLLLTNESEVNIEYVARITDVSLFDPLFVQALALGLAMAMCMRITQNASLLKALTEEYRMLLSEAMTMDAQEGTARAVVDVTGWIAARL